MMTEVVNNINSEILNKGSLSYMTSPLKGCAENSGNSFQSFVDAQNLRTRDIKSAKKDDIETLKTESQDVTSNNDKVRMTETSKRDSRYTLGDLKKNAEKALDKQNMLTQTLVAVQGEVSVEKALDLTLARDINDIIDTVSSDINLSEGSQDILSFDETNDQLLQGTTITDEATSEEITLEIEEDILKDLNIESIKAEIDDSSSDEGFMSQKQSPEEHAVKAMMGQDNNFELNVDKASEVQNAQKPVTVNQNKIIEQITKQLEGLNNNPKVSIVLNPESLGKVDIQIVKTANGMSAQFTVMTQEAKDVLMKGLNGLRESLISHGIGVDDVSVKISDFQKAESNSDWTEKEGSRGGNKEQQRQRQDKEQKSFDKTMEDTILNENDGNV